MKTEILAMIGEPELRRTTALNAALAANDRLKYVFSVLQTAAAHAAHPDQPAPSLKQERIACGIDDEELDLCVAGSAMAGQACRLPGAAGLLQRLAKDTRIMAAPVLDADPALFAKRVETLVLSIPDAANDLIDPTAIVAMTKATRDGDDSLHRLVMDMHKRLNHLQAASSEEKLAGAAVYGLADADRPRVKAFMNGLNRTAKLKFNHPGLATTATRIGQRLVIQNDLGTTDAHVIVIHVEGLTIDITYTDVHAERLAFFKTMLNPRNPTWGEERTNVLGAGSAFYLATGHIEAATEADVDVDLEFIGSRLVFLIDWNRARKQLRSFMRRADRLALLDWAAQSETGHRGFLELGGAGLVNRAVEATAGSSMHFGDRLCDVLGDEVSSEFLRFVFQTATEGRLSGQSEALVQDRVRVALARHFSNEEKQLIRLAGDHAGLIFEIASLVSDGIRSGDDHGEKRSKRAHRFEHDADQLVQQARKAVIRRPDHLVFQRLLEAADDAADGLEDAASLLALQTLKGKPCDDLQVLADLLVDASQEWIKALGHAEQIGGAGTGAETEDFLLATDRVAALEHQVDDAERTVTASAIKHAGDFRHLHLFVAIGGRLEEAADALKRASDILHDHVLETLSDG